MKARLAIAAEDLRFLSRSASPRVALVVTAALVGTYAMTVVDATFWLRVVFAAVVPWVVARQLSLERGGRLVELIANAAEEPAAVLEGKMLAALVWCVLLLLACAPALIVTWASSHAATGDLLKTVGLAGCAAAVTIVATMHFCMTAPSRLRSWGGSTLFSAIVLAGSVSLEPLAGSPGVAIVMLVTALVLVAWLRRRADLLWTLPAA